MDNSEINSVKEMAAEYIEMLATAQAENDALKSRERLLMEMVRDCFCELLSMRPENKHHHLWIKMTGPNEAKAALLREAMEGK